MRILLTGRNGQVGWELQKTLAPLGELTAPGRAELDLRDGARIDEAVRAVGPDVIVNAAAYTAVDKAESEREAAFAVNAVAPRILAEAAKRSGALLVHYSTDYVFDGTKATPYLEDDAPNPLNVYGESKLAGERAIQASGCRYLILRTSWVYGARGSNFLLTILRLAAQRQELRVVDDQIGAPTTSAAIAAATGEILSRHPGARGIYHFASSGKTSWCGFAREILGASENPARVVPIPASEFPAPARRPRNSLLNCTKLARDCQIAQRPWQDGLRAVLRELEDGVERFEDRRNRN